MRVAVLTGSGRAEVVDAPDLQPGPGEVLVRVEVAPMCAEYKRFVTGDRSAPLGHEAAGVVVSAGSGARARVGERIVVMPLTSCGRCALCRSGDYIYCQESTSDPRPAMADYVIALDHLVVAVQDDLALDHAAMACCGLGASYGAVRAASVTAGSTLLVTGLGPVGLGAVINGVYRNATVLAVEGNPYRQQLARDLGADAVLAPDDAAEAISERTRGVGVDVAIECSGARPAQRLSIDATRQRGIVVFVGESTDELSLQVSRDLLRKGLTLRGSWHYPLGAADALLRQIARCGPQLDRLITHHFPLGEIQSAFETQASGQCGKIVVHPNGDR